MSNESMIKNENRPTFTNLFHKFIRLTIKTDHRDKQFKKKNFISKNQRFSTSSKQRQHLSVQSSSIYNQNNTHTSIDYDSEDKSTDEVRIKIYFQLNKINNENILVNIKKRKKSV